MAPRENLQKLLEDLLGSTDVHFQPGPKTELNYPCIVYTRGTARTAFASNSPYRYTKQYQITVIDRNPDSAIPDRVAQLQLCTHVRWFAADGLNHDIFNLYF